MHYCLQRSFIIVSGAPGSYITNRLSIVRGTQERITCRCSNNSAVREKKPPSAIEVDVVNVLTHWGRVTHICVGKLTNIDSDDGLSPERRQAIIWTNAGILLIGPLGTNFSENLFEIITFSFTKMRLKVSSAKWRPFCLGLNVLTIAVVYSLSKISRCISISIIFTVN